MRKNSRPSLKSIAGYSLAGVISLGLILASWFALVPMSETEVFGFLTGAASVWLTVRVNIWNWPIGIANSAFYLVLFFQDRLFADATLQIIYIILGFWGWYLWLYGGERRSRLPISRISLPLGLVLAGLLTLGTIGETIFLEHINDSAPFLDALTTALSLVAQFMLTKKLIENWYVWITADVIYIGLYLYKSLYLTSILYIIFLLMCLAGLRQWRLELRAQEQPALVTPAGELVNG
jgi:nicotinamide mononucleotide transporter